MSVSRPIAACGGDSAGMLWASESELIAKLIHRARQARWGLSNTLAETTLAEATLAETTLAETRAELRR